MSCIFQREPILA